MHYRFWRKSFVSELKHKVDVYLPEYVRIWLRGELVVGDFKETGIPGLRNRRRPTIGENKENAKCGSTRTENSYFAAN
jgi:hypothetical protein